MTKKHNNKESSKELFPFKSETIGLFFLGVGITMFILNLITILNALPYLGYIKETYKGFPLSGYYISMISSIILIGYSLYNIYAKNTEE